MLIKHLKLELRSSPMTPLGVVADRVASSHTNPLRNWSVLLLLLGQNFLDLQSLVRPHFTSVTAMCPHLGTNVCKLILTTGMESISTEFFTK